MNILRKLFAPAIESRYKSDIKENFEVTPKEQIDFANEAIEVFNPVLKQFGFKLLKFQIDEYGTTIIWIKDKCYIKLGSNTHPHDSPNYYGIALGEFKEDYFHYVDLDCVGLWRLKTIQENLSKVNDTPFPLGDDIKASLIQTKDELLKYGNSFLQGDLTKFYHARKMQWNRL